MERHGSESYFVLGEGLLTESVGGRARTLSRAVEAAVPPFRFSRLGPNGTGRQLGEPSRKRIAAAMTVGGGGTGRMPAGFTYLGQFTDHDLTFDKTNVMLGQHVSPTELLQARSPSLDLDSLYGAGPTDPGSAQFYEADGVHLKTGTTLAAEGIAAKPGFDLPRGAGTTAAAKRKAIIPIRGTTRISWSPRPTWLSSVFTTASSTHSRDRCRLPRASQQLGRSSRSTISGCCVPTTCRESARGAS